MMIDAIFTIENLIEIVKTGGKVKTGIDVYNKKGRLLLGKNILVDRVSPLETIQENGIRSVPVNFDTGGLWDGRGNLIRLGSEGEVELIPPALRELNPKTASLGHRTTQDIEQRVKEIETIKKEASQKYDSAKKCLKKAFNQIRHTKGQFDVGAVRTQVSDLVNFSAGADHPFLYLAREIFSYDEYLYQHSINVGAIATAVLYRFNAHFSRTINTFLWEKGTGIKGKPDRSRAFNYYYREDLSEICLGFFLHDIGKAMVPEALLNKSTRLTDREFKLIKRHSFDYGTKILEENGLANPILENIVGYHHAPLFDNEKRCYPLDRDCSDIPPYVRICKLADIYDAMASKRSYKDALNQVGAITQVFRKYVKKETMLQFVLRAFVESVGLYPPGSIVYLKTGQMAYVLESNGPLVIPFTDKKGDTLENKPDPIDLGGDSLWKIDSQRSIKTPREVYTLLPSYIKKIALP
jgi:HD-GYP domain-containing protein (c-di-GMP phosphodiesterase class II)